jgi:hypothetical protein
MMPAYPDVFSTATATATGEKVLIEMLQKGPPADCCNLSGCRCSQQWARIQNLEETMKGHTLHVTITHIAGGGNAFASQSNASIPM